MTYIVARSEEHTSELQSPDQLVCRLLLEKKKYQSVLALFTKTNDQATVPDRPLWGTVWQPCVTIEDAHQGLLVSLPPFQRCLFFNDTATTEIYTLSLHDALPISAAPLTGYDNTDQSTGQPDRQLFLWRA